MSKYEPLGVFLRRWGRKNVDLDAVELSFADIERIIGAMLPRGSVTSKWWGNEPSRDRASVQCASWLGAGFEAHLLENVERVLFQKTSARRDTACERSI